MEECKSADVVSLSSWAPYGLKQLPFTQHTEYRMYAMPHIWFRVLRSLQSFLRGTQVLAVFTGAHGVGKRSLLQEWLLRLDDLDGHGLSSFIVVGLDHLSEGALTNDSRDLVTVVEDLAALYDVVVVLVIVAWHGRGGGGVCSVGDRSTG